MPDNNKNNRNKYSSKIFHEKHDGYPEDQKGAQRGNPGGEQGDHKGIYRRK